MGSISAIIRVAFPNKGALLLASLLLAVLPVSSVLAQQDPIAFDAQRQVVGGSLMALYQSYDDDTLNVSQLSIPLMLAAKLGEDFTLSLQANQMSTSGDGLTDLSGLSDAQLILGYTRAVGSGSIVLSLGANLPVGKKDLTREEFNTVILISQRAYDFRVPSLGQGFGLSPSLTWATPLGANTAVGIGASYQVRGGYRPLDTLTEDYTPGNEILITGGVDTRLDAQSTLSLDISHSVYAADQLGTADVFESGSKTTVGAMYRYVRGFDELRVVGVYRKRAKSKEVEYDVLVTESIQTVADQSTVQASYRMRVRPSITLTVLAEGRMFSESRRFPKRSMVDVGVVPAFRLSPEASLITRVVYTFGTLTGFEVGTGLAISL